MAANKWKMRDYKKLLKLQRELEKRGFYLEEGSSNNGETQVLIISDETHDIEIEVISLDFVEGFIDGYDSAS